MSKNEYLKRSEALCDELEKIPGYKKWRASSRASRRNEISYAVSCKVPEEKAGLKGNMEKAWFNYLWKTAELHEEIYGFWPVFEAEELESDDPRLEIYGK